MTVVFEQPGPDFDPMTASPRDLERYGFPPRPSREHGFQFEFYERLFGPPFHFERAKLVDRGRVEHPKLRIVTATLAGDSGIEASRNWSGAYIESNDNKTFGLVAGRWTVPPIAVPPGDTSPPGTLFACSHWIGLDGQRLYRDSTLPQIGTRGEIVSTAAGADPPRSFAWTQWWARDVPGSNYKEIVNFDVLSGDEVICLIVVWGAAAVTMFIRNSRTGDFRFMAPPPPEDMRGLPFVISGATAEWVVERPTALNSTNLIPLGDYGRVEFKDCLAVQNGLPPGEPEIHTLAGSRMIRMFAVDPDPPRTPMISYPTRNTDLSFRVDFGQPPR